MSPEVLIDLIAFFNKNKESLVAEWENSIVISKGDPYSEKIRENGISMFNVILNMDLMSEQELLDFPTVCIRDFRGKGPGQY